MVIEIWTVSISFFLVAYWLLHGEIAPILVIKSVFPTLSSCNWYMTCYLLFYMIHPVLNEIIRRMDQRQLFRASFFMSMLYIVANFIKISCFSTELILWVTFYFVIAYMQKYLRRFADSKRANLIMLIVNMVCFIGVIQCVVKPLASAMGI